MLPSPSGVNRIVLTRVGDLLILAGQRLRTAQERALAWMKSEMAVLSSNEVLSAWNA